MTKKTALLIVALLSFLSIPHGSSGQDLVVSMHDIESFVTLPKSVLTPAGSNAAELTIVGSPAWLEVTDLPNEIILSITDQVNFRAAGGSALAYNFGAGTATEVVVLRAASPSEGGTIYDHMADGLNSEWVYSIEDPAIFTFDGSKLILSFFDAQTPVNSSMSAELWPGHGQGAVIGNITLHIVDTPTDGGSLTGHVAPSAVIYNGYEPGGDTVLELRLEGPPHAFHVVAEAFGEACNNSPCISDPVPLMSQVDTYVRLEVHTNGIQSWMTITNFHPYSLTDSNATTLALAPGWNGWASGLAHTFGVTEMSGFSGLSQVDVYSVSAGNLQPESTQAHYRITDDFDTCTFDSRWQTHKLGALQLVPEAIPASGCRIEIDSSAAYDAGGNSILLDDTPNSDTTFSARFELDTSQLTMSPGDLFMIWGGKHIATNIHHVQLQLRRDQVRYTLQLQVRSSGGVRTYSAPVPMNGTTRTVQIRWHRDAADGGAALWLDGVPVAEISGLDTSDYYMDIVRFGAIYPLDGAGTLILDDYVSWP